ncbi:hypothetical protein HDZ31DRAFT_40605 [Schizophyllum fasciatum]
MPATNLGSPTLPEELIEAILDELAFVGDYDCLRVCAVSHRLMTRRCQQHLFSSVRVVVPYFVLEGDSHGTACHRLLDVLRGSTNLAEYIHHLVIEEGVHVASGPVKFMKHGIVGETALLELLPMLSALRQVEISSSWNSYSGDDFIAALALPSVEKLVLRHVRLPLYALDSLPNLRCLVSEEVYWFAAVGRSNPLGFDVFLGLLSSYPPYFDRLTTLRVSDLHVAVERIEDMIDICKSTLERIEIRCPCTHPDRLLVFSRLANLRDLTVTCIDLDTPHTLGAWRWLFSALPLLRSLHNLTLQFRLDSMDTALRDAQEWGRLDETLGSGDQFRCIVIRMAAFERHGPCANSRINPILLEESFPCTRRRRQSAFTIAVDR